MQPDTYSHDLVGCQVRCRGCRPWACLVCIRSPLSMGHQHSAHQAAASTLCMPHTHTHTHTRTHTHTHTPGGDEGAG
jgi:hypothetical protein